MYGFIEKDSDLKIEDAVYDEVLNAGLGWMHELKKGQTFRILDIEGNQAVDTTFYDLENPEDHYGAVQTIVAQKNIYLTTGSILRAESGKPLLESQQTRQADTILWAVLVHRKAIQSDMREKRDICTTAVTALCYSLLTLRQILKSVTLHRISTSL